MHNTKLKNTIKIVILCLVISLASFYAGTSVNKTKAIVSAKENNIEKYEQLKPLINVMNLIEKKYVGEVETNKLVNGAISGMVQSLKDPYSVFMEPDEFKDFIIAVDGSFEGVGISLGVDEQNGDIVVVAPIEGTPAQKAGILPKDVIVKVNDVDLKEKSLDEAVNLIRGEKGSKVTIYIKRPNVKNILKFDLIRDSICLKSVKQEILDKDIGYIKISSFTSNTADEFKKSVDNLKKHNMKALILDLRNNPGGSLLETVNIADQILDEGLIVYTEDKHKNRLEEYYSDGEKKLSMPLAVLINENSASASEILAGAIQDFKAGKLIGKKTYGKGSVQELEQLENGAGLKLTIAKYYIPSGKSIDGIGIKPDIEVDLDKDINPLNIPRDKDAQLKKAIDVIKQSK